MWYGLLSTYTTKFGENFDFYGGIDLRYYKGLHQNVIVDLFGGDYFIDAENRGKILAENNPAAADPNFKNQKLGVGDVYYRDYDGFVMSEGAFAQLEYIATSSAHSFPVVFPTPVIGVTIVCTIARTRLNPIPRTIWVET